MSHMDNPDSPSVFVRLTDNQRGSIIISVKESTALITFR